MITTFLTSVHIIAICSEIIITTYLHTMLAGHGDAETLAVLLFESGGRIDPNDVGASFLPPDHRSLLRGLGSSSPTAPMWPKGRGAGRVQKLRALLVRLPPKLRSPRC